MNKQTNPTNPTIPIILNNKKIEFINTDSEPSLLNQRRTSCTTP